MATTTSCTTFFSRPSWWSPKQTSQLPLKRKGCLVVSAYTDNGSNGDKCHAIVTGGNVGIGKGIALGLAKEGMHVTLACRNKERGEAAAAEISKDSGNPNVRTMICDLASFKSVQNFAQEYQESGLPLHVLVNNAGVMACPHSFTEDGYEMQFGVNHLGHFLLTGLLLDKLVLSSSPGSYSRVVVVSSLLHHFGTLDLKDPNFTGGRVYHPWMGYFQSKLANNLFSLELSRRLRANNVPVTSNSLHPGIVDTELFRHYLPQMIPENTLIPQLHAFILRTIGFKTIQEGAETALNLAISKKLEGISGYYFEDSSIRTPSSDSQNLDLAAGLWKLSEENTGSEVLFPSIP